MEPTVSGIGPECASQWLKEPPRGRRRDFPPLPPALTSGTDNNACFRTSYPDKLLVVIISSLAAGIGSLGVIGISGLIVGTVMSVIGWGVLSGLAYLIGVSILKTPHTQATWGELLRAIGFAYTPGILRVFAIVPFIGPIIAFGGTVLILVAAVIAARTALHYTSTLRAVAVAALAWIGWLIVQVLVLALFIF